ncbi:MAG: ABC transporter permease subunit [Nitriliruptorales bacterium]|nr:ABC transporter permease subunit [Nitriliruptorales bacterium]
MSATRVWRLLAKDLRLGPRSPLVLWALVLPVALTLLLKGVFGGLLDPKPRLGFVHQPSYEVTRFDGLDGIEVTRVGTEDELMRLLRDGRLDAGVVVSEEFLRQLQAGEQPRLDLRISGASAGQNRGIIIAGLLGAVRELAGGGPDVEVDVVTIGEAGLPIDVRLLPLVVIMAVAIAGAMVPASSLVEEKERRTLQALFVSPASPAEVFLAKGLLGGLLAMAAGLVTLALNDAFGTQPAATVLGVAIGAVMMAEIGLLLGAWAPDTNTLFAAWKGGALLLLFPVVVFIWPDLPTWIARLGPTYYFLRPIYAVSVEQANLADVWLDLAVGVLICVALVPAVLAAGRWLERRLAEGRMGKPSAKSEAAAPA